MNEDYKNPTPKKNPHDDLLDAMLQAKLAADKQYYAQDIASQQAMRNATVQHAANQMNAQMHHRYSQSLHNIANQMHVQDAQLGRGIMAGGGGLLSSVTATAIGAGGAGGAGGGGLMGAIQGATVGGPVEARHDPYILAEGAMRRAQAVERRLDDLTYKIERLSGFYHWVTEVHPEMAAQYKAMRDLYDAANGDNEKMKPGGV